MRTAEVLLAAWRTKRGAHYVACAVLAIPTAGLLACLFAIAIGYGALVVRSGSMSPAIQAGDIAVTRLVRPRDMLPGQIITFRDPSRAEALVTHRVMEAGIEGGRLSFVTRGDANTGVERWSIDADGTVGTLSFRIPTVAYVVVWVRTQGLSVVLLWSSALILGTAAVRRI